MLWSFWWSRWPFPPSEVDSLFTPWRGFHHQCDDQNGNFASHFGAQDVHFGPGKGGTAYTPLAHPMLVHIFLLKMSILVRNMAREGTPETSIMIRVSLVASKMVVQDLRTPIWVLKTPILVHKLLLASPLMLVHLFRSLSSDAGYYVRHFTNSILHTNFRSSCFTTLNTTFTDLPLTIPTSTT